MSMTRLVLSHHVRDQGAMASFTIGELNPMPNLAAIAMCTLVTISCMLHGGCSFAPSSKAMETADFGPELTRSEAQSSAESSLKEWLWYPTRIEWLDFGQAWMWNGALGGGHEYGYALTLRINEQHPETGYLGAREYYFFYRAGAIKAHNRLHAGRPWGFMVERSNSVTTPHESPFVLVPNSPRPARYGPNGMWR